MATIKDVAKEAEVSVATVSRALNKSGYVSEEAYARIMKAVMKLDYKPNEVARSLYTNSSKIIGLLLPDIANPFFPLIARGVEDFAMEKGYMVLLANVENNTEKEKNYIEFFTQYNISGILSVSNEPKKFDNNTPIILLDRVKKGAYNSVAVDHFKGGQLAAKKVIEHGAMNVLIMVGPREENIALDRLSGAESILKKNNIDYDLIETKTFQVDAAEKIAKQILGKKSKFDSIISSNDIFALEIIKESIKREISIPDELQIIGYDNIPASQYSNPALTTIEQPAYQIGYQGAELLFDLIENNNSLRKNILLEPKVIERNTLRRRKNGIEDYSNRKY